MGGNCSSSPKSGCTDSQTISSLTTLTDLLELKLGEVNVKIGQINIDYKECCTVNNGLLTDIIDLFDDIIKEADDCCKAIQANLDKINDELQHIIDGGGPAPYTDYPCGKYSLYNSSATESFQILTKDCDATTWNTPVNINPLTTLIYSECQVLRVYGSVVAVTLVDSCINTTTEENITTEEPVVHTTTEEPVVYTTTAAPVINSARFELHNDYMLICSPDSIGIESNVLLYFEGTWNELDWHPNTIQVFRNSNLTGLVLYNYIKKSSSDNIYNMNNESGLVGTYKESCENIY